MISKIPSLLIKIIENRLELFSLELSEEKIRFSQLVTLTIIASTCGLVAIIGATILIIWALPPDERLVGGIIAVGIYAIVSVVLAIIGVSLARKRKPFEGTIATLEKDTY
ncbi:MAG: phage holin family protein [Spirochaetia bacterium]